MNSIFVGREKEIREFKKKLESFLDRSSNITNHSIVLIHGFGGIGKTTLLKKLKDIVENSQGQPFKDSFDILELDWGNQEKQDLINRVMVLKIIYEALIKNEERKQYFQNYTKVIKIWESCQKKYKNAEEKQEQTGKFVEPELTDYEKNNYGYLEDSLVEYLADGINDLSQKKPLLIFFDTYEVLNDIDVNLAIQRVIKKSGNKVIWIIAGRNDLTQSISRNLVAQEALTSILERKNEDADIVALAIRNLEKLDALENSQLIHFLDFNKSPDRYVREAAANAIKHRVIEIYKSRNISNLKRLIIEVVPSLIKAMRNDFMKDSREAATDAGKITFQIMKTFDSELMDTDEGLKKELISIKHQLELALIFSSKEKKKSFVNSRKEKIGKKEPLTLIQDLDKELDLYEKVGFILLLGELKAEDAIERLVKLLSNINEEPDIRASAAESLGEIGGPVVNNKQAIDALIDALEYDEQQQNNGQYVRSEAARALGKLVPPKAIKKLYEAIRIDKFSSVRDNGKKALSNYLINSPRSHWNEYQNKAFKYLLKTVTNPEKEKKDLFPNEEDIQQKLITESSAQGQRNEFQSQSIDQLIDALKETKDPDECVAIAKQISSLKDAKALEPILDKLEELKEGDWIARTAVVKVLGQLDISIEQLEKSKVIKILVDRWRNDPISDVRNAVQETIENIYLYTSGNYELAEDALNRYIDQKEKKYRMQEVKNRIKQNKKQNNAKLI
ncbi:MAG: HEAT repeat domain-containing protein [Trichodesmium sp. MAG_R02]|jgi:HEAT repeat protein|nr:HEAT repeat domain-containing protein [Trichodesmium sp. MAG_R02]